ncbi:hypothetical protein PUN28_001476 [Cardiocondyla obscurior]|uniref:Uncharacterized protein n=1 Tax=Cardiocondyla obscurior TaxID=286306 RepID=A0AAW2H562_9HYME
MRDVMVVFAGLNIFFLWEPCVLFPAFAPPIRAIIIRGTRKPARRRARY